MKYAAKNEDGDKVIGMDGLMNYMSDLGLDLEDLVTICLTHLLHCKNIKDDITRDQFLGNWFLQGCSDIAQMKQVLVDLNDKLHSDKQYFIDIYNYTFGLITDPDKDLEVETAVAYWKLFLQPKEGEFPVRVDPTLLNLWFQFLDEENKKFITQDYWHMLVVFFQKFPNLNVIKEGYDETAAWPYIIDEYYEYLQDTNHI